MKKDPFKLLQRGALVLAVVLVLGAPNVVGAERHSSCCNELWCCDYHYDNSVALADVAINA